MDAAMLRRLFEETINIRDGEVASYIPQLANVNPDLYGVCFCDTRGNLNCCGDVDTEFCLQSCSKPLTYCVARTLRGDMVHQHVGYEPSGRAFNAHVLNDAGLPHNPLINAGAIVTASLVDPESEPAKRFETVINMYQRIGTGPIGFQTSVYLSERQHADRNTSLAWFMRESGAFEGRPDHERMQQHLDLYYQLCSVSVTCKVAAVMAATLANGGTNPVTSEKVLDDQIVTDAQCLMYGCGMYDWSGQFGFEIGLPAKSGVSGCLMLVIPGVGGICTFSPRLDRNGNSVRGVAFCQAFSRATHSRFHVFHSVTSAHTEGTTLQRAIQAAAEGDVETLRKIEPANLNKGDYDGRTPLHLAAAEGQRDAVEFLLRAGVHREPKDRWGTTPEHEARQNGHSSVEALFTLTVTRVQSESVP